MRRAEVVERLADVAVASVLLLLVMPLGACLAILLACTGEGEVFYRQWRIGRHGKRFQIWKLATMLRDSPRLGTGSLTVKGDPRVLPVGRFLRKWKLNELPQLWNVLRGEMSLVGPRPLASADFDCYSEAGREIIVRVRPGLTGLGSLAFRDEEELVDRSALPPLEAYRREIAPRKENLERWYVEHRSVWLDLRILALTLARVIRPRSQLGEALLARAQAPLTAPARAVEALAEGPARNWS